MTTSAHHSHDVIERLERMRDDIDARIQAERNLADKLADETERALLIADCISILRQIPTRNLSEGQRLRVSGVLGRLKDQLGKVA
jgi:hypothetical protein